MAPNRRDKGKGRASASEDTRADLGSSIRSHPTHEETASPLSTEWTPWVWNNRGYYWSSRTTLSGTVEYKYEKNETQAQDDIPRSSTDSSANELFAQSSGYRNSIGSQGSNYDIYGGSTEIVRPESEPIANYIRHPPQSVSASGYCIGWANTGNNISSYAGSSSTTHSNNLSNNSTQVQSPGYSAAGVSRGQLPILPSVDSVSSDLSSIHLGRGFNTLAPPAQSPANAMEAFPRPAPKTIQRERGSKDYEKLDPRYRVVPTEKSRKFWRAGRVFMMLWSEPAGETVGTHGGTRNGSHISTTMFNCKAFSEIRRLVVVKDNEGNCGCLAIHTYSGRATLKPNLPDPQNHAIIYTTREVPPLHSITSPDGTKRGENLPIDPIKVIGTDRYDEGKLDPLSRINFTKTYTVEKNVRILNIGMVSEQGMITLQQYSPLKMDPSPPIISSTPSEPSSGSRHHHRRR